MKEVINEYNVVPLPVTMNEQPGRFYLNSDVPVVVNASQEVKNIASSLSTTVLDVAGIKLKPGGELHENVPTIVFDSIPGMEKEAYKLSVTPQQIKITASTPNGFYYGLQTLYQLLPVAIYSKERARNAEWSVPCVEIEDTPAFRYRGAMLDVCRHFASIDYIKKFIDVLAVHKMNTFHWHLTDDQGWRIEIKKYPKLTEIGSIRKETGIGRSRTEFDGKPYGGFYTQDEIRDIVKYAQERFVTVIPEIDLPGHMLAALAAYPELGCTGGPYEVARHWGVFPDVLCIGNEKTYEFLEGVLSEVIELFPAKYIHIGGDEAPRTRWAVCPKCQALVKKEGLKADKKHTSEDRLQSYCMKRVEQFLNERGRQIIGWDEILEGDVAPNATVMSWRGMQGGIEAAKLKHDVIMTPNDYVYFDYYQSADKEQEPMAMGSCITVEKVYNFEPVADELADEEKKHILGAQANVWTEYIGTPEHVEYMMVPRMAALAEVQWMMPEKKSYQGFLNRLGSLAEFYKRDNVNYAKHILPEVVPAQTK